jgi:two-component system LytT family response regulator
MKVYIHKGNDALLILNHKTRVFIDAVVLLESDINYTIFHLEDGNQKMVAHTMKFFEPFLETRGFLRVHRSFMINPNHVKNMNKRKDTITMTNGQEAMISRRRKNLFKNLI